MSKKLLKSSITAFSLILLAGCGGEVVDVTPVDTPLGVEESIQVQEQEQEQARVQEIPDVQEEIGEQEPINEQNGVSGAIPQAVSDIPSPFDENAPVVELSPEEKAEAQKNAALAKECTDGGGLFNTEMGECFASSEEESKKLEGKDAGSTKLEILDSDDDLTVKRKECINGGGTYNSQVQECFNGSQ